MIRIAIVDDHPAVLAGLEAVLRGEPGLVPVGSARQLTEVEPLLYRTRPDIILLDYHLPGADGLVACRHIKLQLLAPRVLLYTAYASSDLALPARLAGADGVLGKGVPARELYDAVRRVSRGERIGPPLTDELLLRAQSQVNGADSVLLDRLLEEVPHQEICAELGLDADALGGAIDGLIATLRVDALSSSG